MARMNVGGIIVAAGRGVRMGGIDKCALPLRGRAMASYSVATFAPLVAALVVVVAPGQIEDWKMIATRDDWPTGVRIVGGGETRQSSARAGVDELLHTGAPEIIAIHDGARPLVTADLACACFVRAATDGAAIAAVPVTDTIKRVEGERIVETPNRAALWAAQTPQAFRTDLLLRAFAWSDGAATRTYTDEAGLIEAFGHPVHVVLGERMNIKVTEPPDRIIAEALIAARVGVVHG